MQNEQTPALIDMLTEARDFIDRYSDVNDGSYGVPEPNDAMVMVHEINATLEQVASPASSSSVVQGDASGMERAHGPKCWGTTSFSDEVAHCYCGPSEDRPQPSGETREAVILKGIGKINGDGWKDTTTKGEVVFVWNAEKPAPYSPGQYPRIGNEGWSASTSQYDFTPASADDIAAIIALLRPAAPDAGGGEDLAGKLKAIRDKFLFPTPDKDHTDYAVMTRCIAALQPGGER